MSAVTTEEDLHRIKQRDPVGEKGLDEISITGGVPLRGSIRIQGSKNAALPIMAAALLHHGISVLKGCPRITDVFCMEKILGCLGARTWWEGHDLYLDCEKADQWEIPACFSGRMRSSVILLGALLGRGGRGRIGYPGGCVIGKRPVDMHFHVLKALGAEIVENGRYIEGICGRLKGNQVLFEKRSVGATQQGILAAVLADGETFLHNCATEPEIGWLCCFLKKMGAEIEQRGEKIRICGVPELGGAVMEIPPDRIVTGTYIFATAATRGEIIIENPPWGEMDAFLEVYSKMGGQYKGNSGKLIVNGKTAGLPVELLETEVYPGFPTDLQSPAMAALATVPGRSMIREQIFEDRFKAAYEMNRMGAHIGIKGKEAVICGGYPLYGTEIHVCELRGGAALMIAALAAEGTTRLRGCHFIERGYEHICEDLSLLGAAVIKDTGTAIYEK